MSEIKWPPFPISDGKLVYGNGQLPLGYSASTVEKYARAAVEQNIADRDREIVRLKEQVQQLLAERTKSVDRAGRVPDGWADAYAAFVGAFDTPQARRLDSSEYAQDARHRLREINENFMLQDAEQQAQRRPLTIFTYQNQPTDNVDAWRMGCERLLQRDRALRRAVASQPDCRRPTARLRKRNQR